jgi:hypothetical protein
MHIPASPFPLKHFDTASRSCGFSAAMPEAGHQVIYGAVTIGMLLVHRAGARVTG